MLNPDVEASAGVVAIRVHFETKYPEYQSPLPQIKDILPQLSDGDIGKTFVLAEGVSAEAGSLLLRLVPLASRTSPWEVTLESIILTGGNPTGVIFRDNRTGDALLIGPEDIGQGYGIIRMDELFDENLDFKDEFREYHEAKRRGMYSKLFREAPVEKFRVINAIGNHLAFLAGRVVVDLLEGFYGRNVLEKAVAEIGNKHILSAMSDRDYRRTTLRELKYINTDLEAGSFVLVEGKNGFHIYEVMDGDKAMLTSSKRKPGNRVALREYGITPNYNSYGQTVCEPIHASNVQFIENNILQGIVFFDKQALLEYLPVSNTNLRHIVFQQALSSFCSQLLQMKR